MNNLLRENVMTILRNSHSDGMVTERLDDIGDEIVKTAGEPSYDELVMMLCSVPLTYLPALLVTLVKECLTREVFAPGGLAKIITTTMGAPVSRSAPAITREIEAKRFSFLAHLYRQRDWSAVTFGPGLRTKGVSAHIRKELLEIEADPTDVKEWIDIAILGLDGAWRTGASPEQIVLTLAAKQAKNEAREWPDWRAASQDEPIEHVRTGEQDLGPDGESIPGIDVPPPTFRDNMRLGEADA